MTHEVTTSERKRTDIELRELVGGQTLRIVTGVGQEAWRYDFLITETDGQWPMADATATMPDGTINGPSTVKICGSGIWTTRDQNPVQDQARAFTSSWQRISTGQFLVIADPETHERASLDKNGQEITSIEITDTA